MEDILGIDDQFPMSRHCAASFIDEWHQYIMEFAQKTADRQSRRTAPSSRSSSKSAIATKSDSECDAKEDDVEPFRPLFDVEAILDEKEGEEMGDGFLFQIRWRRWPKAYDCWIAEQCLDEASKCLIDDFRRRRASRPNLGQRGFTANYWNSIYSKPWAQFMDGHDNGRAHAEYAFYFFKKYGILQQIRCIADYGFGRGNMLEHFVRKFRPKVESTLRPMFSLKCNVENAFNCHFGRRSDRSWHRTVSVGIHRVYEALSLRHYVVGQRTGSPLSVKLPPSFRVRRFGAVFQNGADERWSGSNLQ